ncbi:MAG TPA: penicillin acylase family protein [Gemmatimonadaceae bacterium]|nr:penicillin acylase family protein [Gemmatimonadaceae bacterium]
MSPVRPRPGGVTRVVLAALVLAGGLWIGARPVAPAPALGPLLDPAHGVWALARGASVAASDARPRIDGLRAEVRVLYDDRAVPHVFATTIEDAYRALGYVVARDRLAQLHVQTLAATGRLTELAGAPALELDREMRRLGLPRAAERAWAALPDTAASRRLIAAYADGVNAYLDAMPAGALPVEFRLTGTRPARWAPVNSLHLFARMGWTLAYITPEGDRARAAARVGRAVAEALFPIAQPIVEPIQPNGQTAPRFEATRLPPPGDPEPGLLPRTALLERLGPERLAALLGLADEERAHFASNNWAVAPRRTAAGHALLAGDPHLELTLPSIWYEAHLVVPGQLDVHGVTIPGAPGIIIGFNRDVAWTFTNTGADVLDFYQEQVDHVDVPTRYRLDGAWRPIERRLETYVGKSGRRVAADTLYFTHRGPMRREGDRWLSMRWTVLEPTDVIGAFLGAARARTVDEFQAAMARGFGAPAQNMLAADRAGSIFIRSTGCFPVRPDGGSGLAIRDGSTSAADWRGCLPVERWPQARNPAQGFVASANQQPIDARVSGDYWGGEYDPWRALRINELLRGDSAVTPETMRLWQTDPGSERAALFAPAFVRAAQRTANARARQAGGLLAQWDRRYTRENRRAVLFEAAMQALARLTWDELTTDGARRVATPSSAILAVLLADSASAWWDDRGTSEIETRDDILARALASALDAAERERGAPDGDGWRWDRVRHANIGHLLRLPQFSALEVPVQGGPSTLNPSSGRGGFGASWRMVVELGPEVRAWATYPGGQSGHPSSDRYLDRLPLWRDGRLAEVFSPRRPEEMAGARTIGTLTLQPGAAR